MKKLLLFFILSIPSFIYAEYGSHSGMAAFSKVLTFLGIGAIVIICLILGLLNKRKK